MGSVKSAVRLLTFKDSALSPDQGYFDVFLMYYPHNRVPIKVQACVLYAPKNEKDVQFYGKVHPLSTGKKVQTSQKTGSGERVVKKFNDTKKQESVKLQRHLSHCNVWFISQYYKLRKGEVLVD